MPDIILNKINPVWESPNPINKLFDETFDSLSNWTVTSPANAFSVSGGDLLLNKAVAGGYNLNDYILQTSYAGSCLENWTIDCYFKVTEKSATCNGFFVGVKSTAAFGGTNHHVAQFNTNTASGRTMLYLAGATSPTITSAGALTFSVNDECRIVLERNATSATQQTMTVTVYNLTNVNNISLTYTFVETFPVTIGTPPTSQFAIYSGVGTVSVHSYTVTTNINRNCNIIAVGDSITRGIYSLSYANRWFSQLTTTSIKNNYAMGGPGDRTTNVLERINEIKNVNSRYILLAIGGNDLDSGVALATVQANYIRIYQNLLKTNRIIYNIMPTPRDSFDFTTWNSWLSSNFSNVIDVWTPLKGAGFDLAAAYDSGDGTHPNTAGHTLIASTIFTYIAKHL